MRNRQVGPDDAADVLADVVANVSYKDWSFQLEELSRGQGCEGLTLLIQARVPDSWDRSSKINFLHLMPVLPAAYDREAWIGWVFEQIRMVELHESMEWFEVDGRKVFFPEHRPGANPYRLALVKPESRALEPAVPWSGGLPKDEHFS